MIFALVLRKFRIGALRNRSRAPHGGRSTFSSFSFSSTISSFILQLGASILPSAFPLCFRGRCAGTVPSSRGRHSRGRNHHHHMAPSSTRTRATFATQSPPRISRWSNFLLPSTSFTIHCSSSPSSIVYYYPHHSHPSLTSFLFNSTHSYRYNKYTCQNAFLSCIRRHRRCEHSQRRKRVSVILIKLTAG